MECAVILTTSEYNKLVYSAQKPMNPESKQTGKQAWLLSNKILSTTHSTNLVHSFAQYLISQLDEIANAQILVIN